MLYLSSIKDKSSPSLAHFSHASHIFSWLWATELIDGNFVHCTCNVIHAALLFQCFRIMSSICLQSPVSQYILALLRKPTPILFWSCNMSWRCQTACLHFLLSLSVIYAMSQMYGWLAQNSDRSTAWEQREMNTWSKTIVKSNHLCPSNVVRHKVRVLKRKWSWWLCRENLLSSKKSNWVWKCLTWIFFVKTNFFNKIQNSVGVDRFE